MIIAYSDFFRSKKTKEMKTRKGINILLYFILINETNIINMIIFFNFENFDDLMELS